MNILHSIFLSGILFAAAGISAVADAAPGNHGCRTSGQTVEKCVKHEDCRSLDGNCQPGMRGHCGKRKGDWYGARSPVANIQEARERLEKFYAGQYYSVAGIVEKKWGFEAELVDRNGTVVDRILINRRSGRVRSIY